MHEWIIVKSSDTAQELHNADFKDSIKPTIIVNQLSQDALVLGSSQSIQLDTARASENNIEICKRKSGGGLVYMNHKQDLWVDIYLPNNSPLFVKDIGKSFLWVGQLWKDALSSYWTKDQLVMAETKHPENSLSKLICFEGVGHGEILLNGPNGKLKKIVGLSQKRKRHGCKIQCLFTTTDQKEIIDPYLQKSNKQKTHLDLLTSPYLVNPESILENLIIDLQENYVN